MKLKVALCGNSAEYRDYMRSFGLDVTNVVMSKSGDDESIEKLKGYNATAAMGESYSAKVLEALKDDLKIIVRHGIGYDRVDIDAAAALGICCCNCPGSMSTGVAETTLTMMLEMTHSYYKRCNEMLTGKWNRGPMTHQLEGATVGLLGFGNIAQRLARYLQGFRCRVLAYDIKYNEEALKELGVAKASVEEIARASDFVSVHVPLLPSTAKMVDKNFLSMMKTSAYLINTSRGGTVDEAALIEALREKVIAGAALDVFEKEPTPADNPLRGMDNVFLTPHMATATYECTRMGYDGIIKCMKEYEAGEVPEYTLNPGYVKNLRF